MAEKFHERFDIEVSLDEGKRRFVNRVDNDIFRSFLDENLSAKECITVKRNIASRLGESYRSQSPIAAYTGRDFNPTLYALETIYNSTFLLPVKKKILVTMIESILKESELDLGVRWKDACFIKSGAELLDKKLINDVLRWLRDKSYKDVLTPYEKGLRHFFEADKRPEVLADVITDIYEALEALAKIFTKHPNSDLSKNAELFIKSIKASEAYKEILNKYIDYANRFRHSSTAIRSRPPLSVSEVESFIYITGIFIRLAITGSST
jgi:hypothetical protein